jgi:hypothetical protein
MILAARRDDSEPGVCMDRVAARAMFHECIAWGLPRGPWYPPDCRYVDTRPGHDRRWLSEPVAWDWTSTGHFPDEVVDAAVEPWVPRTVAPPSPAPSTLDDVYVMAHEDELLGSDDPRVVAEALSYVRGPDTSAEATRVVAARERFPGDKAVDEAARLTMVWVCLDFVTYGVGPRECELLDWTDRARTWRSPAGATRDAAGR